MTPEAKLLKTIIARLKQMRTNGEPLWWLKLRMPGQRAGVPDLLIVCNGRAIFVEVKSERGTLTPLQEHELGKIKAAGAMSLVARSVEEVERVLVDNGLRSNARPGHTARG